MEARIRACPGEAEEAFASLARKVLSMTPAAKAIQLWHLGAMYSGRCAQAAMITPVKVVPAAARAAPRRVTPLVQGD
jgi:hypothetical protein